MKILIFGIGKIYHENKQNILKSDTVVALLDNNPEFWGTRVDGIEVHNPKEITQFTYDRIVLMSVYAYEMKMQLLEIGCRRERILSYMEYIDQQSAGKMEVIFPVGGTSTTKGSCLIITTCLDYDGGTLAAIYAAMALMQAKYEVTVAAPDGDINFIEEMKKRGITFILYKNLPHAMAEELNWIQHFQYIMINTLQMICCAITIAKSRNVILWLHEPLEMYHLVKLWKREIEEGILQNRLKIYAVSSIARNNFFRNFSGCSVELLPYGIPDEFLDRTNIRRKNLIFAVIGTISQVKGQDILIDAIKHMKVDGYDPPEFWIIGKTTDEKYRNEIETRINQYLNIQILGKCTRKEMTEYYQKIDVLVIPSREETMSIVATEAMMFGKVCIISDTCGMADYVEDGYNGLKFSSGNSEQLAEKMMWCLENGNQLKEIGKRARSTYEKKFSMDRFQKDLENIINQKLEKEK